MTSFVQWLVFGTVFVLGGSAEAGVVHGTLRVPSVPPAAHVMNAYPGHASALPGQHAAARGAVSDAVIYLERVAPGVEAALAAAPCTRPRLAQKDQCFMPRVVATPVGTAVDFPNMDPIYHNVFSVSPTRRFDLGKYPRGHSKSVTFDHAGLVNVYCDIHSDMAAFVLVVPNHAFTQPAADGTFALPAVPPGRYTLHLWHPDFTEVVREIEVHEAGDPALELSF